MTLAKYFAQKLNKENANYMRYGERLVRPREQIKRNIDNYPVMSLSESDPVLVTFEDGSRAQWDVEGKQWRLKPSIVVATTKEVKEEPLSESKATEQDSLETENKLLRELVKSLETKADWYNKEVRAHTDTICLMDKELARLSGELRLSRESYKEFKKLSDSLVRVLMRKLDSAWAVMRDTYSERAESENIDEVKAALFKAKAELCDTRLKIIETSFHFINGIELDERLQEILENVRKQYGIFGAFIKKRENDRIEIAVATHTKDHFYAVAESLHSLEGFPPNVLFVFKRFEESNDTFSFGRASKEDDR